ncbi:BrnT family toxin [Treponema parvum]|uniref:BrnT family toxin n=1 Tax=Treponema parvum TaxID=138851 RepID=A0A975F2W2_9SPIR|nr:BrnT family toxin [Treponema parvum]QTQ13104.1 BrnT family toxin [Treponema parvum]
MPKGKLVIKEQFEWFSEKSEVNKKHGFVFDEILDVFDDPYFYEIYDIKHSELNQTRYNGLGYAKGKLQVVQIAYTENGRTHIISARPATSQERKMYYDRVREIYSQM